MNHGHEPPSDTSTSATSPSSSLNDLRPMLGRPITPYRRRPFPWLLGVALVALIGSLFGGAVLVFNVWGKTYEDTTKIVQANIANPADAGPRPTR